MKFNAEKIKSDLVETMLSSERVPGYIKESIKLGGEIKDPAELNRIRKELYSGKLGSQVIRDALREEFKFQGHIDNVSTASSIIIFKKLANYCGVPYYEANKFTTTDISKELLSESEKPDEVKFIGTLKTLGFNYTEQWKNLYERIGICFKLDGIVFNKSIHASGIIMTNEENVNLPLDPNGEINFNGVSLEEYGYVKYDMLSLDTLNPIRDIMGFDIDWDKCDDIETWETLQRGDTKFVFQLAGGIPVQMMRGGVRKAEELAEARSIKEELDSLLKEAKLKFSDLDNEDNIKIIKDLFEKRNS